MQPATELDPLSEMACSKCRKTKAPEKFHTGSSHSRGRSSWCIDCTLKARRKVNYPTVRIGAKKKCNICLEFKTDDNFCRNKRRPDGLAMTCRPCDSARRTANTLGVPVGDVLLIRLAEMCDICGVSFEERTMRSHIDHDHRSGKLRGALCSSCNTGIGLLKEDPKIFRRAEAYLHTYLLKHAAEEAA